jgi:hypothetical protein
MSSENRLNWHPLNRLIDRITLTDARTLARTSGTLDEKRQILLNMGPPEVIWREIGLGVAENPLLEQ